jgi:hypothetical protein
MDVTKDMDVFSTSVVPFDHLSTSDQRVQHVPCSEWISDQRVEQITISLMIVNLEVLEIFRSSLSVVKNHSHELVHSTSTKPIAIG